MIIETSSTITYCGYCDEPLRNYHVEHYCEQMESYDNYLHEQDFVSWEERDYLLPENYDADGIPLNNFECFEPEANDPADFDRNVEWDTMHRTEFSMRPPNYWRDVEPQRCTHRIEPTFKASSTFQPYQVPDHAKLLPSSRFSELEQYEQQSNQLDFEDPRLMNLEFNELQGFISSKLIDEEITEAYHYRFFNIFVGKDKKLHIGLITLTHNDTLNSVQAQCHHVDCRFRDPNGYWRRQTLTCYLDSERTEQEDFIQAIIRHGNNHGPSFYTKRPDFAFIHKPTCDTLHSTSKEPCNDKAHYRNFHDLSSELSSEETLEFLIEHRKFCRNSECRCTHYYHLLNETNYRKVS